MTRQMTNEYAPDYVSPPGETLQELLEERGMPQAELAQRTGRPKKTINEIVQGKAAITPETALQLEHVLGVPAGFWNRREANYREHLARLEEESQLAKSVDWLTEVPLAFMIKKQWVKKRTLEVSQVRELLSFFGVSSPQQWDSIFKQRRAHFRQSSAFHIKPGAVTAWMRQGEIRAHEIATRPYDRDSFLESLHVARAFTKEPPDIFEEALRALCADVGVAVVFVPAPKECRASGVTQWLSREKALIQLSLRYKTDDQLWFTFFHEAGHILKHGKRAVFLEGEKRSEGTEEEEADRFASDLLIPPSALRAFVEDANFSRTYIVRFAREIEIAPGIVVGRLQHEGLLEWNSSCNRLKKTFRWTDE